MGVAKRVISVVGTVLKFDGRLCVAWMGFVMRAILLLWHSGS